MSEFTNCQRKDLGDGYMVCEDVQLASGDVCTAYFGPCGVYVISTGTGATAGNLYRGMRELLGTVHVRLYIEPGGLYDPAADSLGPEYDDDKLTRDVNEWLGERRLIYKQSALLPMVERLEYEDARSRGYRMGEDGALYVLRQGKFTPASPVSSDSNYMLALFGGTLGLHRFAMGKVFSGLAYLLTGGIFLVGWLTDLLFLFLGIQKDRKKRYLLPLSDRRKKLLLLPAGLVTGVLAFLVYLSIANSMGNTLHNGVTQQMNSADPESVRNLFDFFSNILPELESEFPQ